MKIWFSQSVRIVLNNDSIVISNEDKRFSGTICGFPWQRLIELLEPPGRDLAEILANFEGKNLNRTKQIIAELFNDRIIVPADGTSLVRDFHSASHFGSFFEQIYNPCRRTNELSYEPPSALSIDTLDKASSFSPAMETLTRLLLMRESSRKFPDSRLRWRTLAIILHCGYSLRGKNGKGVCASAGGIRPLRFLIWFNRMYDVKPGLSNLDVTEIDPDIPISDGNIRTVSKSDIFQWFLTKELDVKNSAATVFILADLSVMCRNYGIRGYRYCILEAGAAIQNMSLAAAAMGINHVQIGAFRDDIVADSSEFGSQTVALHALVLGGDQ